VNDQMNRQADRQRVRQTDRGKTLTYVADNNWLVVIAGGVHRRQQFVEMLRHIVLLIHCQCVQQLSCLDARRHHPVTEVADDARQNLGEIVIDKRTTAEIGSFN